MTPFYPQTARQEIAVAAKVGVRIPDHYGSRETNGDRTEGTMNKLLSTNSLLKVSSLLAIGVVGLLAMSSTGIAQTSSEEGAGPFRTQTIQLKAGWNAVFLEVDPLDSAPAQVFSGLPVDKVATLFDSPSSSQFVTDPGVDLFKGRGWGVWYAPGLPEAFLKSLDAINGNRAYLVHAKSACQWRAKGQVRVSAPGWQPDAYNFIGFPVRSLAGPTFQQFFAGSEAHADQAIYRLVDGRWKKVLQPSSEAMRSGEAFWIFCDGGSDYQGPLSVETESGSGLVLGASGSRLVLRNVSPHPLAPTIAHLSGGGPAVPLSILVRSYGDPAAAVRSVPAEMPAGAWEQSLPPLEIDGSVAVPFECRGGAMSKARQTSLLKITTDLGTEIWLPVVGLRSDLAQ